MLGSPIQGSKSPLIYNYLFSYYGIDALYTRIDATDLKDLASYKLAGANITSPLKRLALNLCKEYGSLSKEAKEANAVNTMVLGDSPYGYNTDIYGLKRALLRLVQGDIAHVASEKNSTSIKSALILGGGGVIDSLKVALHELSCKEVVVHSRHDNVALIKDAHFTLIIDATSASFAGELPCARELLAPLLKRASFALSLIYAREYKNPFLDLARACDTGALDGLDMLIYQGLYSFHIYAKSLFGMDIALLALDAHYDRIRELLDC